MSSEPSSRARNWAGEEATGSSETATSWAASCPVVAATSRSTDGVNEPTTRGSTGPPGCWVQEAAEAPLRRAAREGRGLTADRHMGQAALVCRTAATHRRRGADGRARRLRSGGDELVHQHPFDDVLQRFCKRVQPDPYVDPLSSLAPPELPA